MCFMPHPVFFFRIKCVSTKSTLSFVLAMTETEMIAQSILFLAAGYDTTSLTVTYLAYCLALNPDVQEKLIEEIDTVLADKVGFSFSFGSSFNFWYQIQFQFWVSDSVSLLVSVSVLDY